MRYILKRDNFLTKDKVNEVFKNELTWGGSLLGRLINSGIRKAKIEFKKARIDEVLNQIEATIYEILRESLIKDDRVKYYRLLLKSKYAAIKDVSLANDPNLPDYNRGVDCRGMAGKTKFSELIGQDPGDTTTSDFTPKWRNLPSGLIDDLLNDIETLDEVGQLLTRDQKEKLRDIHSDFAVELRKCRWIKCNNKFPGGDRATKDFWLGKVPITDADKELKSEISVKNESLRSRRIFSKFLEFENYRSYFQEISEDVANGNYSRNSIGFNSTPSTTTTTSTSTTTSAPTTTTTTTSTTTSPGDSCNVSELWKWFFDRSGSRGKDLEPLLRLSRDDEKELADLQSRLTAGTLTLNYNIASDAIIRLLNLLYTAYDIFATEYIPSGRPGGRVSLKTFQEYQKLEEGSGARQNVARDVTDAGGTAVIPGFGPWAINVVYSKFQRRMRALHEDQELRKIFANVNFNYPGSEDKFNDSYKYSQSKLQKLNEGDKGGLETRKMGPELFKLLADLTNPRQCNPQKIDNAWRKYFGQEPLPETSKRESNENSASNRNTPESSGKPFLSWWPFSDPIQSKGSYCLPSKELTSLDKKDVEQDTNGVLNYVNKGGSVPIYITVVENSSVPKIEVKARGIGITFRPVKITFKTPSVANNFYESDKSKYKGYTDYTDIGTPNPNIYYGYCAMNTNLEYWIFYVDISEPNPGRIDYQKLKVNNQNFTNRKNPSGAETPKQEDKVIEYSILKDGNTSTFGWQDLRKAIDGKDDNANFEEFFGRNIGSTGISFKEYMKNIFNDDAANTKRIGEICT
jgi:hypothetical protein